MKLGVRKAAGLAAVSTTRRILDRQLQRSDSWSAEQLRFFSDKKLTHLLNVIFARCDGLKDFYRSAGFSPGRVELRADDFTNLPVITKAEIRALGDRLLIPGPRTWIGAEAATGGSTGEPLRFRRDLVGTAWAEAALRRGQRWMKIGPRSRGLHLKSLGKPTFLGRARQRLQGFRTVPAFPTDRSEIDAVVQEIRAWRPDFVTGYPSSLLAVARAAGGEPLRVPLVFATGETLLTGQRPLLEQAFGGRVAEYYGSNEVQGIAFECEQRGLHVTQEHVIVEVLDDGGRPLLDSPGRVVVTDLDNQVMPFIRYELGDRAIMSSRPCPCGRAHAVLGCIQGRAQDVLRSPSGRELHAVYFSTNFRSLEAVQQYQLVQVAPDVVEVRFLAESEGRAASDISKISAAIAEKLGPAMHVRSQRVDAIELTPRGKTRLVVGFKVPLGTVGRDQSD